MRIRMAGVVVALAAAALSPTPTSGQIARRTGNGCFRKFRPTSLQTGYEQVIRRG